MLSHCFQTLILRTLQLPLLFITTERFVQSSKNVHLWLLKAHFFHPFPSDLAKCDNIGYNVTCVPLAKLLKNGRQARWSSSFFLKDLYLYTDIGVSSNVCFILSASTFSSCQSYGYMQPVPKKDNHSSLLTYHPITLSSYISKTFETILNKSNFIIFQLSFFILIACSPVRILFEFLFAVSGKYLQLPDTCWKLSTESTTDNCI